MNHVMVRRVLLTFALGLGVGIGLLTVRLLGPFGGVSLRATPRQPLVPAYDYELWRGMPVEDGRIKPFETQCMELVRQLTGRTRYEGTDPVALVLAWALHENGRDAVDWEHHDFLLCDHHNLRERIFRQLTPPGEELDELKEFGKYIAPADLRRSPDFDDLLAEVAQARRQFEGRAHFHLSTVHLKAEEVGRRLGIWDSLCGRLSSRLHKNALLGEKYLDLQEFADRADCTTAEALSRLERSQPIVTDPLRLVRLSVLPGEGWLSFADLRRLREEPTRWQALVERRTANNLELRFNSEHADALRDFEARLQAGTAAASVDELADLLKERRADQVRKLREATAAGEQETANRLLAQAARSPAEQERLRLAAARGRTERMSSSDVGEILAQELGVILEEQDRQIEQQLRSAILRGPIDGPEAHQLALVYLESRFPGVYRVARSPIKMPTAVIDRLVAAHDQLREAHSSGDADRFADSSRAFLLALRETGNGERLSDVGPYLKLELFVNRTQPFRWAWGLMLMAAVCYVLSMIASRPATLRLGMSLAMIGAICYVGGLLVQVCAFALRTTIAGRAPVGNLYETVVFVAFLSAFFALVLEAIYRRRVIALAGAAVGTLGLMLADQLPLALDPKISPLVPVLRSNFWLTVHVVTIVASYAGATLAWGLGNISLALLAFGRPNRDTLKSLSRFIYRAMQIAVVLLAMGTFLGGWWASEAWGRFWGWDPKEVGALIALVCYVIPLHARYAGWIKDFGLAVAAVLCYASIILSWYVINFVIAAGLHSYGFSGGGGEWVLWAGLLNLEWVLVAMLVFTHRQARSSTSSAA